MKSTVSNITVIFLILLMVGCIGILVSIHRSDIVSYYYYLRLQRFASCESDKDCSDEPNAGDIYKCLYRFFSYNVQNTKGNIYDAYEWAQLSSTALPPYSAEDFYTYSDKNLNKLLYLIKISKNRCLKEGSVRLIGKIHTDSAYEALKRLYAEENAPYKDIAQAEMWGFDKEELRALAAEELRNFQKYSPVVIRGRFWYLQKSKLEGANTQAIVLMIEILKSKHFPAIAKLEMLQDLRNCVSNRLRSKENWQIFCRENNIDPDILENLEKEIKAELEKPPENAPAPEQ